MGRGHFSVCSTSVPMKMVEFTFWLPVVILLHKIKYKYKPRFKEAVSNLSISSFTESRSSGWMKRKSEWPIISICKSNQNWTTTHFYTQKYLVLRKYGFSCRYNNMQLGNRKNVKTQSDPQVVIDIDILFL